MNVMAGNEECCAKGPKSAVLRVTLFEVCNALCDVLDWDILAKGESVLLRDFPGVLNQNV